MIPDASRSIGEVLYGIVVFAVAVGIVYLILIFLPGQVMTPFRIYVTGEPVHATVEDCDSTMLMSRNGATGYTYSVLTDAASSWLPIADCRGVRAGSKITVLYSEAAGSGVALLGGVSLWSVMRSVHNGALFKFGAVLYACIFVFLIVRITNLAKYATKQARLLMAKAKQPTDGRMEAMAKVTEAASSLVFLAVLFVAVGVALFASFRALLFLKSSSEIWFGLLSFISLACIWSPLPEGVIALLWQLYRSHSIAIARNLVGILLLMRVGFNMIRFVARDLSPYETLFEVIRALFSAALGL